MTPTERKAEARKTLFDAIGDHVDEREATPATVAEIEDAIDAFERAVRAEALNSEATRTVYRAGISAQEVIDATVDYGGGYTEPSEPHLRSDERVYAVTLSARRIDDAGKGE